MNRIIQIKGNKKVARTFNISKCQKKIIQQLSKSHYLHCLLIFVIDKLFLRKIIFKYSTFQCFGDCLFK